MAVPFGGSCIVPQLACQGIPFQRDPDMGHSRVHRTLEEELAMQNGGTNTQQDAGMPGACTPYQG
jgi:hypothetical protein